MLVTYLINGGVVLRASMASKSLLFDVTWVPKFSRSIQGPDEDNWCVKLLGQLDKCEWRD